MMSNRTGFTLAEILIVVMILGLLAMMVIPQLGEAAQDARFSALRDDLRTVRSQCELYRIEHRGLTAGVPAGGGDPDEATLIAQLTAATDIDGVTRPLGTPGFDLGPYMVRIPINPINRKSTVRILGAGDLDPLGGTDQFGWVYRPATKMFRADSPGADDSGMKFYDY